MSVSNGGTEPVAISRYVSHEKCCGIKPGRVGASSPMEPRDGGHTRPRLLDLFCGAGGAAMGYSRAGFEVVGVDIKPQPNYPFEFFEDDALNFVSDRLQGDCLWWRGVPFTAIHASPPCQRYSTATKRNGTQDEHPDLIGPTRELLKATGLPYIIENVVGAPLWNPQLLCGASFDLTVDGYALKRHRLFECSWNAQDLPLDDVAKEGCRCVLWGGMPFMDVTGGGPTKKPRTDGGGGRPYKGTADQARRIMGIDWMTKAELNEAIPPAYTEFIGAQLIAHLKATARVEIPATDLTSAIHALPGRPMTEDEREKLFGGEWRA